MTTKWVKNVSLQFTPFLEKNKLRLIVENNDWIGALIFMGIFKASW